MKTKFEHLAWIDWLRFIAAFLVLATHARGIWPDYSSLDAASRTPPVFALFALTRLGLESVVLFFVLSGFLVGGRVVARLRDGSFSMRDYAVDRFTRIYVPLVPALIYSGIAMANIGTPGSWRDLLGNLLSIQGAYGESYAQNGALWSLSYEVWLYVFMGCIAWWHSGGGTRALIGLALSCALLTKFGGSLPWCWFLGAAAYSLLSKKRTWLYGACVAIFVLCGLAISMLGADTKAPALAKIVALLPPRDISLIILALGMCLMVPWLAQLRPTGSTTTAIESFGSRLANWSYTLYLTHSPTLHLLDHYLPYHSTAVNAASLLRYSARLGIACFVAWVLYLLFEKQTANVRRWIKGRAP